MTTYPTVTITLGKPISGYWDGGLKSVFEFTARECQDAKGKFLKWGSFAMNFWRNTNGIGCSPRQAAGTMAEWLRCQMWQHRPFKIEIEQDGKILKIIEEKFDIT